MCSAISSVQCKSSRRSTPASITPSCGHRIGGCGNMPRSMSSSTPIGCVTDSFQVAPSESSCRTRWTLMPSRGAPGESWGPQPPSTRSSVTCDVVTCQPTDIFQQLICTRSNACQVSLCMIACMKRGRTFAKKIRAIPVLRYPLPPACCLVRVIVPPRARLSARLRSLAFCPARVRVPTPPCWQRWQ